MDITFNADEVFEMACQIERNGAKFYRTVAERVESEPSRELLLRLAEMEDQHEQTFQSMREAVSAREEEYAGFDAEGEAALYLQSLADGKVFDYRADPSEKLTGSESMDEVLRTAIGLEKDSIIFYVGMKEMVPSRAGKEKMDAIVAEEMSHITLLAHELDDLTS